MAAQGTKPVVSGESPRTTNKTLSTRLAVVPLSKIRPARLERKRVKISVSRDSENAKLTADAAVIATGSQSVALATALRINATRIARYAVRRP
jgi:hypothetical protein